MNMRYVFVSVLAIVLAGLLLVLPEHQPVTDVQPEDLLLEILDETRFFRTVSLKATTRQATSNESAG